MARPSQLVFSPIRHGSPGGGNAQVLASCADGIPIGWLFCFGTRNVWEPGDSVQERGGTSAERNRFENGLEAAQIRVEQALNSLESHPHAWVWFAPLHLLHRRLLAQGRTGFVWLEANWAFHEKTLRERMILTTALVENVVNQLNAGNHHQAIRCLEPLAEFAPFAPLLRQDDARRFEKTPGAGSSPAEKAARLVIGDPPGDPGGFVRSVDEFYAPILAGLPNLPPYPAAPPPAKAAPGQPTSVVNRLLSLFRKS